MFPRFLIAAGCLLSIMGLWTKVSLARSTPAASLSSQVFLQDLPFHYPVHPSNIGLFGELRPPSTATLQTRACLSEGSSAMFWLPALSHAHIHVEEQSGHQDLKLLKLSGPKQLQGILAFVEHPISTETKRGVDVYNSDTVRRAFLVSSASSACIRIQGSSRRTPNQAWSRAWRSYWNTEDPRKDPPADWFDHNPTHPRRLESMSQTRALRELTRSFPESRPFARWLGALHRLELATQLRPQRLANFGDERLLQPEVPELDTPLDFSNPAHPFAVITPTHPLAVRVQGPGIFELRARVSGQQDDASSGSRPRLQVNTQNRRIADLALLPPNVHSSTPDLGPVTRHRFWLPKGEHRIAMAPTQAKVRVSLRQARATPRLAARLSHATIDRALRKAEFELRKLRRVDPALATTLAHLLAPWQREPKPFPASLSDHQRLCHASRPWLCAYSAKRLSLPLQNTRSKLLASLSQACQHLRGLRVQGLEQSLVQQQLAGLSQLLVAHHARPQAAQCLGQTKTLRNAAYLEAALNHQGPGQATLLDPWIGAAMAWFEQKPASLSLKRAYLRRKKEQSRLFAIAPTKLEDARALYWFQPLDEATSTRSSKQTWTQLAPNRRYTLVPEPTRDAQGQVMRLVIAPPPPSPKRPAQLEVFVKLGTTKHRLLLNGTQRQFHWILSPHHHQIEVLAPPETKILCDLSVQDQAKLALPRFAQRKFWQRLPRSAPLRFDFGSSKTNAPRSIKLRVQVSDRPEYRQILPLHIEGNNGSSIGVWLHYDPKTIDPSIQFGDFPRTSYPISIQLGALSSPSQFWIRTSPSAPKLALSFLRAQLRSPIPASTRSGIPKAQAIAPQLSAQGPGSLQEHLHRANFFFQQGQLSALRDELAWIASSEQKTLDAERSQLLALLRRVAQRSRRALFAFTDPQNCKHSIPSPSQRYCPETSGNIALRAQFLDSKPATASPSKDQVEQALRQQAARLDLNNDESVAQALAAVSTYISEGNASNQSASNDALVFGMLDQITKRINGSVLSAWKGKVARRTRWKSIEYASQSAGHEWLGRTDPTQTDPTLPTPWQDPAHTLILAEHQSQVLQLDRPRASRLKVQGSCRPTRPSSPSHSTSIHIKINRHQVHQLALKDHQVQDLSFPIAVGKTRLTLSIPHLGERTCMARVLEQDPIRLDWSPVDLRRKERWFVAKEQQAVTLHARGPGTLKLQVRSLNAAAQPVIVNRLGPTGASLSTQVVPSTTFDPNARIQRASRPQSSTPVEHSLLMSHPGVYRFEVQSQGSEYLVRAKTRVAAQERSPKVRFRGVLRSLQERLSAGQPPIEVPIRPQPPRPHLRLDHKKKAVSGIWELQAGAGLFSDLEYDQPNSRWSTQLHGGWLGQLYPNRLWLKTQLSVGSEDRVMPAGRAQVQMYAANRRAWLRGQLQVQAASQYLHRFAHSYGVSGRIELSLRSLRAQPGNWDLLTDLRLSYRGFSKNTVDIAQGSIKNALHRYVYRSYVHDHPFSLRPRLQLVWRRFYDLRAYLGQDLWLNADLKSIDRTRAWLKVSGLVDRYRSKGRVFWSYDAGYRFSYVPTDLHRSSAFFRHELLLDLKAAFRLSPARLWEIAASSTVLTQSQQPASLRFLLSAKVAWDRLGPLRHRPVQLRRYPREINPSDWTYPEPRP